MTFNRVLLHDDIVKQLVGTNGAWIKSIFHTSEHMNPFLIENPFRRCDDVCLVQLDRDCLPGVSRGHGPQQEHSPGSSAGFVTVSEQPCYSGNR